MNVWITRVKRRAKCKYEACEKSILVDEFMVVCSYFMNAKGKRWLMKMYFHPQCWITRAIEELKTRVTVETRGRKRAVLSDKKRSMRVKILMRRASVNQRIGMEMSKSSVNTEKVGRLVDKLDALAIEIKPYGGVPKSWN